MTEEKSYYTYMVRCSDNSLYTGFTTDLSHRVSVHNRGKGARYTRSRLPVQSGSSNQTSEQERKRRHGHFFYEVTHYP